MNIAHLQFKLFQLQLILVTIFGNRFFLVMVIAGLAFLISDTAFAALDASACPEEDTDCVPSSETNNDSNNPFRPFYDFVYNAATGYLGRGIALTGGIIGLGFGAASGKALPAVVGIVLAMFGALGPRIINALFAGALI